MLEAPTILPNLDAGLVAAVQADKGSAADDVVLAWRPYPHREVALSIAHLSRHGNPKAEDRSQRFPKCATCVRPPQLSAHSAWWNNMEVASLIHKTFFDIVNGPTRSVPVRHVLQVEICSLVFNDYAVHGTICFVTKFCDVIICFSVGFECVHLAVMIAA